MLLHTADTRPRDAVFKVQGSLAAILSEKVWSRLLSGEAVGVIEPDPNRWSLYIAGGHVKTYTAGNLKAAISKVFREHPELASWVIMPGGESAEHLAEQPVGNTTATISNGYPYLLCLEPAALAEYQRRGTDAAKQAAEMRARLTMEFKSLHAAVQGRNVRAVDILGNQIHTYGLKREGQD